MFDLASTISPKGLKLFDLVKALGGVSEDDFIDACPGPFLLQVPMQGGVIPEAQPRGGPTAKFDANLIHDPSGTIAISRSSIMKLQRSSDVESAILHLVIARGDGPKITIGRADDCDVTLGEATVSKKHAEISQAMGNYMLCDLGSHNGTFIDGTRLEPEKPMRVDGLQNLWFSSYRAVFLLPEQLYQLASNLRKKRGG